MMNFQEFLKDRTVHTTGNAGYKPLISVITPTYCRNMEGLLKKCIDSVQNQTFKNYEHIILDDGSIDGTAQLIEEYAKKDGRIVSVRYEQNSGLPAVRTNEGILLARGEYITFVFDDTEIPPQFLEKMLFSAQENETDIQYGETLLATGENEFATMGTVPIDNDILSSTNVIANGAVLCRKTLFDEIGLYDPALAIRRICDWDLWLRALHAGATFTSVKGVQTAEHGVRSPNSLGNTVFLDYKICFSYIFDLDFAKKRTELLKPNRINDYNVFDIEAILPYARNYYEMVCFERDVYLPYFNKHPHIHNDSVTHTRLYDMEHGIRRLNPFLEASCVCERVRILILCAGFHSGLEVLRRDIRTQNPAAIILHCSEFQLAALYAPEVVDLILLADCTNENLLIILQPFRDAGVPIGYVAMHGPSGEDRTPSKEAKERTTLLQNYNCLNESAYFPCNNNPWSEEQERSARRLMTYADFTLNATNKTMPDMGENYDCYLWEDIIKVGIHPWSVLKKGLRGKKCLIFTNSALFAGSEAYGVIAGQLLHNMGFQVEICVPARDDYHVVGSIEALNSYVREKGLDLPRQVCLTPGPYYTGSINQNLLELLQENVGLVVASSLMADVAAVANVLHIPSVFCLFSPSNYRPQELGLLKTNLSAVISDSQWTCDIYNQDFQLNAKKVIDLVEEKEYHPFKINNGSRVRIAVIGTLQQRKQQFESICVCKELLDEGYDIALNLYGYDTIFKDYVAQMQEYVQTYQLEKHVNIWGFVDDDNEIIQNNDIVFSVSAEESLPQSVLFHMAAGLVGVSCPVAGIGEIILDGNTGYLATGFGAQKAKEALKRALDHRDEWETIVKNAQELFKRECNEVTVSQKLLAAISPSFQFANQVFTRLPAYKINAPEVPEPIVSKRILSQYLCASYPIRHSKSYNITVTNSFITRIGLIFTGLNGVASGNIKVSIYFKGHTIREKIIDMETIIYNQWVYINIEPLLDYEAQILTVCLQMQYNNESQLCVYEDMRNRTFWYRVVNKLRMPVQGRDVLYVDLSSKE